MASPTVANVGGVQGLKSGATEVKAIGKLIDFTSTDNTVTITPNATTKVLDFSVETLTIEVVMSLYA